MTSLEAEKELKSLITDEFLSTLTLAVRSCGWTVDHIESSAFVEWCFDIIGKDAPDLTPFEYED